MLSLCLHYWGKCDEKGGEVMCVEGVGERGAVYVYNVCVEGGGSCELEHPFQLKYVQVFSGAGKCLLAQVQFFISSHLFNLP